MSVIEGCKHCKGTGKIHVSYTNGITYHVENCPECCGLGFGASKEEPAQVENKNNIKEINVDIEVCADCFFLKETKCIREAFENNKIDGDWPTRVPSSKPISCKIKRMKIILEE
jgi:RecJ-like exonuclease